ncbi:MAG: hypothetical protein H7296_10550 [Bacteroidia bacterium]|nr:hypothetical protein [Bacteroidia bacterium]
MSHCSFSIEFNGDANSLITKVSEAINGAGGVFNGDTSSGNFSTPTPLGEIIGNYMLNDSSPIHITISKKPFLVSCKAIEGKLNDYLNG